MKVDVAIIPAAGRGTRMRPATRVVPKALITVIDRPAVQYVVEEAARAGAKEVLLIVDLDAGHLIQQHFLLEGRLPGLEKVKIRMVVQEEPLGLGHAVFESAEAVGDRPFFCLLADNIVRPGADVLPLLARAAGYGSAVCLRQLIPEFLSRYGVVMPGSDIVEGTLDVAGAVEKPSPTEAPSNLGLIGRYVFTPEIFDILAKLSPGHGGEIQLTDAIDELAKRGRCRGYVAEHDLLDIGNPEGLVEATRVLGAERFPDLA
ncbi:MAG: UTP--glucose-1-phosphate uridylyltransferase [Actinomycetota bacterium]